jgi:hypothetical protein
MKFFAIVGFTLVLIGILNLAYVAVEIGTKSPVYVCSEVTKADPINVQKRCKK